MNKALKYAFILIGGYLVLANSVGFGRDIKAGGGQVVAITKGLQGR